MATGIIRAQGNRFIKELLRSKGITIGTTKDEFEANLRAAIHSGHLTLADVETWFSEVEGWSTRGLKTGGRRIDAVPDHDSYQGECQKTGP